MKNKIFLSFVVLCNGVKAQTWSPVSTGMDQAVYAFATYNSNLYVGGSFTHAGGNPASYFAQWNGTNWSNIGTGTDGGITAFTIYNNALYAGGSFNTAGGVGTSNIAKWDGVNWQPPGAFMGGIILTISAYNSSLYIGGHFAPGPNNIVKWDGSANSNLGSGLNPYSAATAFALIPYQGELYVGGSFSYAGPIQRYGIAKWNDTSWSAVGTTSTGTSVRAFAIHNGDLYVGGDITYAGSSPVGNIAKWDGTNWSAVGTGVNGRVLALTSYNGELYAGGNFTTADGNPAKHIAKWDGTNWTSLGAGTDSTVRAFGVYNGDLYVGGDFTHVGGNVANYIAKWNSPVGLKKQNNTTKQIKIYPNPSSTTLHIESDQFFENSEIEITNVLGQIIFKMPFTNTINVSTLTNGFYNLKIVSQNKETYTYKFIKN